MKKKIILISIITTVAAITATAGLIIKKTLKEMDNLDFTNMEDFIE